MNDCKEILMDDIVRADFYRASTVTMVVPFSVPGVTETKVTQKVNGQDVDLSESKGEPMLSVGYSGSDLDVLMDTPSHKSAPKREAIGEVYQHTLQIPVILGFEAAKSAIYALNGEESVVVLTAYDGTKLTVHHFPHSSRLTYEDSRGGSRTGTLKYEAESYSGLVMLTKPTTT